MIDDPPRELDTIPVHVRLRDRETGETRWSHESSERWTGTVSYSVWWWYEGNGSCDCNRELVFGRDTAPRIPGTYGAECLGCKRYVVVDVEGLDDPDEKACVIAWMNEEYPPDPDASAGVEKESDGCLSPGS